MASTRQNTLIEAEDYRNIYLLTGISDGTQVIVQNIGVSDLYFAISNVKPLRDNDAYRIFKRGEFITADQGDALIWVFSPQEDGLINVEITSNNKLLDLLSANFLLSNNQLTSIIRELKLQNLHTKEMGNTGYSLNDVEG